MKASESQDVDDRGGHRSSVFMPDLVDTSRWSRRSCVSLVFADSLCPSSVEDRRVLWRSMWALKMFQSQR